jgi:hypothetical protein
LAGLGLVDVDVRIAAALDVPAPRAARQGVVWVVTTQGVSPPFSPAWAGRWAAAATLAAAKARRFGAALTAFVTGGGERMVFGLPPFRFPTHADVDGAANPIEAYGRVRRRAPHERVAVRGDPGGLMSIIYPKSYLDLLRLISSSCGGFLNNRRNFRRMNYLYSLHIHI